MKSFGEMIRDRRLASGLVLREVAETLSVDPSFLSRVERGDKRPTRAQVVQLASVLNADEDEFLVHYLSERVVYELKDEELATRAITAAEKRITYLRKQAPKNRRS